MNIRNVIQQYGGIAESLINAYLSFAPVATGTGDVDAERGFQLVQSMSDVVALRSDKFLSPGATQGDGLKFLLRIIKCFQLWGEMRSKTPHQFALRLELIKLSVALAILRHCDERLPDVEVKTAESSASGEVYIGSRTGTRLRSLSKALFGESKSNTQLSDFLHALVPIVYLSSSSGWSKRKTKWTSWFIAIALDSASILALPEGSDSEKRLRIRRVVVESILRQPMFDLALNPPGQLLSSLWNKIPLLRDLNYLEYYLYGHRKYYYFHQ